MSKGRKHSEGHMQNNETKGGCDSNKHYPLKCETCISLSGHFLGFCLVCLVTQQPSLMWNEQITNYKPSMSYISPQESFLMVKFSTVPE